MYEVLPLHKNFRFNFFREVLQRIAFSWCKLLFHEFVCVKQICSLDGKSFGCYAIYVTCNVCTKHYYKIFLVFNLFQYSPLVFNIFSVLCKYEVWSMKYEVWSIEAYIWLLFISKLGEKYELFKELFRNLRKYTARYLFKSNKARFRNYFKWRTHIM